MHTHSDSQALTIYFALQGPCALALPSSLRGTFLGQFAWRGTPDLGETASVTQTATQWRKVIQLGVSRRLH